MYMKKATDLTSQKFGKWFVERRDFDPNRRRGVVYWICRCECGTVSSVASQALRCDDSTQCARCAAEASGHSKRKFNSRGGWCDKCSRFLPLEDFPVSKKSYSGRSSGWCNVCIRCDHHGITKKQHEVLLEHQGGRCAISECTSIPTCIDHDHSCCPGKSSCGKCIRGLICDRHNLGMGYFHDDPNDLAKAARYLRLGAVPIPIDQDENDTTKYGLTDVPPNEERCLFKGGENTIINLYEKV